MLKVHIHYPRKHLEGLEVFLNDHIRFLQDKTDLTVTRFSRVWHILNRWPPLERNIEAMMNPRIIHSDVVIIHYLPDALYIVKGKAKLIAYIHGIPKKNVLDEIALNKVDGIIFESKRIKDMWINTYKKIARIKNRVIYLGYDIDRRFKERKIIDKIKGIKNYVLFVGTLKRSKGLLNLIKATNRTICVAGTGVLKNKIKKENVILLGNLNGAELRYAYENAKVVVLPSTDGEGLPLVLMEAAYFKKPVIATNIGGISEFVKNKINGLIVEKNNIEELSGAIEFIYKHPKISKQFGENSKKFLEIFDYFNQNHKMLTFFKEIAGEICV